MKKDNKKVSRRVFKHPELSKFMSKGKRKYGLGKHAHVKEGLEDPIKELYDHEFVTRIIFGRFKNCKNRYPRGSLKYLTDTSSGIKINGYTPIGVQEIFVTIIPPSERNSVIEYISRTYRT